MTERSKCFVIAHVPTGLEQAFLQHVRDFDTTHTGCHFEIGIDGPDMPLAKMLEMMQVEPKLTFTEIWQRRREQS